MGLLRVFLLAAALARRGAGDRGRDSLAHAVDHIYYINLDRSPERRRDLEESLRGEGIQQSKFSRVRAVDGSKCRHDAVGRSGSVVWSFEAESPPLEAITWDQNWIVPRATPDLTCPTVAVTLSHLRAAAMALDAGHETVLVLEDDTRLQRDRLAPTTATNFTQLLGAMPRGWRVLQVGYTCLAEGKVCALRRAHENKRAVHSRSPCDTDAAISGLFAYVLSRRGMTAWRRLLWPGGRSMTRKNAFGGGFSGSDAGSPAEGLPTVFDLRGVTHAVADYGLLAMRGVYAMPRPELQPPRGYETLTGNSDQFLRRSRELLAKHFASDANSNDTLDSCGPTLAAVAHFEKENNGEEWSHSPGRAYFYWVEPKDSDKVRSDKAAATAAVQQLESASVSAQLVRYTHFDAGMLVRMAIDACDGRSNAPAVPVPYNAIDLKGWIFAEVWQYAHNCGLAALQPASALPRREVAAGAATAAGAAWAAKLAAELGDVCLGYLAYTSGQALQMQHLVVDLCTPREAGRRHGVRACEEVADKLAAGVFNAALADLVLPWSELHMQEAQDVSPAVRELARLHCRLI